MAADCESKLFYVKFELSREALGELPQLSALMRREGAARAVMIACCSSLSALQGVASLGLVENSRYVAIKVPSLEGTEIHWVAENRQEAHERFLGFEKKSAPLMSLSAQDLLNKVTIHPLSDQRVGVTIGELSPLVLGTGILVMESVGFKRDGKIDLVIIQELEDCGNLLIGREA